MKQQEPGKDKHLARRSEDDGQKGNLRKLRKEGKKTGEEVKTGEGNRIGQSCHSIYKEK